MWFLQPIQSCNRIHRLTLPVSIVLVTKQAVLLTSFLGGGRTAGDPDAGPDKMLLEQWHSLTSGWKIKLLVGTNVWRAPCQVALHFLQHVFRRRGGTVEKQKIAATQAA